MRTLRHVFLFLIAFFLATGLVLAEPAAKKKSSASRKTTASKSSKSKKVAAAKKQKKISPQRTARVMRAFRSSSELKPMAQQLVQSRTPTAYTAVEGWAERHTGTDAAALAWLGLGYSHLQDRDYQKALTSLQKAKPRAGELADYVRVFQAQAYAGLGQAAQVIATLKDFDKELQDSIFVRDAAVCYANALLAEGRSAEAVKVLEANRNPVRADVELALGRAYLRTSQPEKGMATLRHLYFTMPNSAEAAQAGSDLQAQGSALVGTLSERKARAELLVKAGRWPDAIREYRFLVDDVPEPERGNMQVLLGNVLRKSGNGSEGKQLLLTAPATGEANAQRLYNLGEIARSSDDEGAVRANLDRMRRETPTSLWLEQALLSAGNMYLLKRDYDKAIDAFRESATRFPNGTRASYAHWKASWLTFRQGRTADAKKAFEEQVQQFPTSSEVPAALYWRARLAEEDGDFAMARAWYMKCGDRFRNFYYGYLSRDRLAGLPKRPDNVTSLHDVALDRISATTPVNDEAAQTEAPDSDLRAEKAKLLENAGLTDFAVKELQAANGGKGANWATLQIARIYQEGGLHHRALQFLKRSIPNYYSLDLQDLPRVYWDFLFPTPYWGDVKHYAADNALNPYLVASLIRQESEFNPSAVSHANAYGLMQLLPGVGKSEAKALRVKGFSTDSLLNPSINIQLGTHYFKEMVLQHNGQVEYALAAYNAGSNRVEDWFSIGKYRDVPEFVESIPFTETREYVQAIMRNAQVYKRLYPQN